VRVEEVLIAPPAADAGRVTHVRSTLVLSSVQSLRAHSLYEHYIRLLDPGMRDTVEALIAGQWLPVETALKHYRACDALGLTLANEIALGHEVGTRIQGSILGLLLKGAKGAGATPWTGLGFMDRLWERVFNGGGGVGLVKLGPKEARAQLVGLPLLTVPYFRHAFRGTMLAGLELFCQRAYVHEQGRDRADDTSFTFRVSWV
jgi:hypothetical protein